MNDLNHNDPNRKRGQVSVIGTGVRAQVCLLGHSLTYRQNISVHAGLYLHASVLRAETRGEGHSRSSATEFNPPGRQSRLAR